MWVPNLTVVMIDPSSYVPVYQQVASALREQIERGDLAPGDLLPSEAQIGGTYGVGRDTVRDALGVLRSEGRIATVRGRGSYVRGTVEDVTVVRIDASARATARMPTSDERRELGMPEGTPVLVVEREGAEPELYSADRHVIEVELAERPAR